LQPYLRADEFHKVLLTLEWLYDRGYVFGEVAQRQIPSLLEDVDPGRIAERLREQAEVIEASELIATVPSEARLVESVVHDRKGGNLWVSAVHSRQIASVSADGQISLRELEAADNLSGLVLDRGGELIWTASGNIDGSDRDPELFAGLIGLRTDGSESIRIAAPEGANPADLAIGSDGTFYTSDPMGGGVYTATPGDAKLSTLVAPGTLRSPQGLAISEDGSKLYVSDYRYGIAIIDLISGEVSRLSTELPIIVDGIDGLWRYGSELIAVQNGTSPMRISAFALSEDGSSIIGYRVLEQAHPEWTEPLGGSIDADALIYVANGQWDRYVSGFPAQDRPPLPTQIRRLPIE